MNLLNSEENFHPANTKFPEQPPASYRYFGNYMEILCTGEAFTDALKSINKKQLEPLNIMGSFYYKINQIKKLKKEFIEWLQKINARERGILRRPKIKAQKLAILNADLIPKLSI